VEPQLLQRLDQPGFLQVVLDHARARRQAGLDVRLDVQTAGDGLLSQQSGGEHHRRIAGVGTTGNGGDHHGAVSDFRRVAVVLDGRRAAKGIVAQRKAALVQRGSQSRLERPLDVRQRHAVLRPLGAGQARLDGAQVQRQALGVLGSRRAVGAEQALLLGITLDQADFGRRASRLAQVIQRLGVNRKKAHRRPVFGPHVGQRRPIGQRHRRYARTEKFDKLSNDALLAENFGDRQNQVRGRRTGRQLAGQLHAYHFRHQHVQRLAQHDRFGLDAPHAPTDDAQSVDHGRVAVGADQRVRESDRAARIAAQKDRFGQEFQIHLMHDAHVRRHGAEVLKGSLAPPQKLVPLPIPREFQFHIGVQRIDATKAVDLDRVVDDQIDRNQRIDPLGVAAQPLHGAAHRRQIHHRGDPRKVLQDHAGGFERDFQFRHGFGLPSRQVLDVLLGHLISVAGPQDGFEQHADRVWQTVDLAQTQLFELGQPINPRRTSSGFKRVTRSKRVKGLRRVRHRCLT